MADKTGAALFSVVVEAEDARSFLRLAMKHRYPHRAITLSELAKKSGFSSKGYLSDLLAGHKKITAKAIPKILAGLDLPKRLESFFELLAQLEEEELRPPGLEEKEIKLRLKRLRTSFKDRKIATETEVMPQATLAIYRHVIYKVYASLGAAEGGASFPQILKRSRLTEASAREALETLLALKIVRQKADRFYADFGNIEAMGLDEKSRLQEVLVSATEALLKKVQNLHKHPQDAYFYASFALDAEKELLLKRKIQELICSFVDENQNEDGDLVKSLLIGFF